MGSGKTGKFLYSVWLGLKNTPDMVTLGKSVTGGAFLASNVLGYDEAVAATLAALKIYDEEKLTEKALIVEDKWKKTTSKRDYPWVKDVTSRGADMSTQWSRRPFIYPAKAAIRVHIAWNITDEELEKGLEILTNVMDEIES
ncbi:hypothetical protein K4K58_007955 [Colletotrichum sp. SAR11_239]|nr:hypothetical protein K4K58_007955 [Colletotrichum sp. SAR11_239]